MMKSNFLNLPSSASGDARRHVPFRSIINKHISILFVLVFVFSILFSYVHPVAALADPVFQPVYDTQFYQLPQFVDPLNSTQQDIFYFILGSQVVEYAGLSDYQIENPYSDPSSVGEWFKKIGIDLYNDVLESFAIAGAPVIVGAKWVKDLYANIAGAANFAGAFNNSSFNEFLSDVQQNGLSLQLYPSMFGALNQFLANNGGLYDWQYQEQDFSSPFTWVQQEMQGTLLAEYTQMANSLTPPRFFINSTGSHVKSALGSYVGAKYDLFINTVEHIVYMVPVNNLPLTFDYLYYDDRYGAQQGSSSLRAVSVLYNPNNFSTYKDIVEYYINPNNYKLINGSLGGESIYVKTSDFIDRYLVGSSYETAIPVTNVTNLNFGENDFQSTLMPVIETLLDIKGLISDLLEQNELKQPALDNLTDLNGDPLPSTQLQPVSVAVELPDSGITINSGLFTPLTKNGGYINYLWYMTKPLVQYTSDLIQTLVFPDDTGEGFDATGPGVIVFGVISLGLIGGLVVKCLL